MSETEDARHGLLGVIGMRGCEELVGQIDAYLQWRPAGQMSFLDESYAQRNKSYIVECKCPRFSTGEAKGLILESVRGYDLYILADVFNYGVTYQMYGQTVPMSPDDHYQDLKRIISALGGKARRITVIMPMLYEGRQHRRFSRESLDCALALQELANMGVCNLITFDAHDSRVQNAVPMSGFENVRPTYQMIKALLREYPDIQISPEHLMVVSPDEGAMARSIYYSSVLGIELGMFYKRRDYAHMVNGRNPIVAHEFLGDNVSGKDVIVVDDMISSGDSMLGIAEDLKKLGAARIFIFSTFGLFCNGLSGFDEAYEKGHIERVFTTNLIYRQPALLERPWYTEVDMTKFLAYIIDTLNRDRSISELMDPVARIRNLLARHRANNT